MVLVLFAAIFAAIVYRWISLERLQRFAPIEISETPTPAPTATRSPVITGKLDTAKLFNGITLHSTVETTPGADAATERIQPESYVLDIKLLARVPSPNKTIDELAKVSPQLPTLLPGLTSMLSAESVSPLFAQLYDTKVRMLRENLGRLDLLLSRHNFSIARPFYSFSILKPIGKRFSSRRRWMLTPMAPIPIACLPEPVRRRISSRPPVIVGKRKRTRPTRIFRGRTAIETGRRRLRGRKLPRPRANASCATQSQNYATRLAR